MIFPYLNHLCTVSRMSQETASPLGPTRACKCWVKGQEGWAGSLCSRLCFNKLFFDLSYEVLPKNIKSETTTKQQWYHSSKSENHFLLPFKMRIPLLFLWMKFLEVLGVVENRVKAVRAPGQHAGAVFLTKFQLGFFSLQDLLSGWLMGSLINLKATAPLLQWLFR